MKQEVTLGIEGKLESVEKFSYLSSTAYLLTYSYCSTEAGGGADEASTHTKMTLLVYGSETWPMKVTYMQRLERVEK